MPHRPRYTGYRSYQYIRHNRDFTEYDLIEGESLFEPYTVPLTPAEEARAVELAGRILMISLHEHPHLFPARAGQIRAYDSEGRVHTAFEALANSWWDCVFDNFLDGAACITSKNGWKWSDIIYDMGMRFCDLAHQDFIVKCEQIDDIRRAKREGRIAFVAAQEGAAMIENELDRIEILYGIGLRVLGITYSESNALGTGLKEKRDGGLTSFGRKAVQRMNDVGLAIDCAHASDQTTLDTVEVSRHPIFLTHTGARGLWNIKRLAPDHVIRAVADKGGVIGIEAAPHTTVSPQHLRHGIESFMDHFEYVKELVGIEHVAFGPDTLYGDHVGLHKVYAAALSIEETHDAGEGEAGSGGGDGAKGGGPGHNPAKHIPVEYVRGIENPTEGSKNILRWLVKRGYSDEDIARVMGENIMRVLKEAWQ